MNITVHHVYDDRNKLTSQVIDHSGTQSRTLLKEYDSIGRVIRKTDALGHFTLFEYDMFGNITRSTRYASGTNLTADPDAATLSEVTYTYTLRGSLKSETDANGFTTTYNYDALGRLTTTTNAKNQQTTQHYDRRGNVSKIVDHVGHEQRFTYDSKKRVLTNKFFEKLAGDSFVPRSSITKTYDANGNVLTVTDMDDNTTTYTYDALNRKLTATNGLSHVTTFAYDKRSQLV